jgi:hypothetical protein
MSVEHERLAIPMDLELKWAKEILTEQNKHLDKLIAENSKLREDLREDLREGISLRDHFAGLAMQGIIAFHGCSFLNIGAAYEYADAMLKERGEKR